MAQLQVAPDSYTASNYWRSFPANRLAQTFVASSGYTITSIKAQLCKYNGSPGTVTLKLLATDGSANPVYATVHATGTTDGNAISTDTTNGALVEITLSASYTVTSGTRYAIYICPESGDTNNSIGWFAHAFGTTGHGFWYSTNNGSTWTDRTDEGYFEIWGTLPSTPNFLMFM